MTDTSQDMNLSIGIDTAPLKAGLQDLQRLGQTFGRTMVRAFSGAVSGGRKLSDVLKSLAVSLSRQLLGAALRPAGQALGQALTGSASALAAPAAASVRPTPFAAGGIVNSPALFAMRKGTGIMAEAGPEAIMPLARGSDGKLGVRAGGGGAVNVTVNITTPDVEGFRQSRSQVSAALARAVERGRGNL